MRILDRILDLDDTCPLLKKYVVTRGRDSASIGSNGVGDKGGASERGNGEEENGDASERR